MTQNELFLTELDKVINSTATPILFKLPDSIITFTAEINKYYIKPILQLWIPDGWEGEFRVIAKFSRADVPYLESYDEESREKWVRESICFLYNDEVIEPIFTSLVRDYSCTPSLIAILKEVAAQNTATPDM